MLQEMSTEWRGGLLRGDEEPPSFQRIPRAGLQSCQIPVVAHFGPFIEVDEALVELVEPLMNRMRLSLSSMSLSSRSSSLPSNPSSLS
jgi:hypothetical protein